MRDELTCWGYVTEFTGQQAALAIVGEPQTDDPAALSKAAPVLDRLRHDYEQTLEWHTSPKDVQEKREHPEVQLVSVAMQDVMDRNLVMRDTTADFPYCAWPRMSEQICILFAGEPVRKASPIGLTAWSLTKLADFGQQIFTRDVLARWVQMTRASTQYEFIKPAPQASTETTAPMVETPKERRARLLEQLEILEKRQKRGALQRLADMENIDRSNLGKQIRTARKERDEQARAGNWATQFVSAGKRRP